MRNGFLRPLLRGAFSLFSISIAYIWSSIVAHLCFPVHGRAALASAPWTTSFDLTLPLHMFLVSLSRDFTEDIERLLHCQFLSSLLCSEYTSATSLLLRGAGSSAGSGHHCRGSAPDSLLLPPADPVPHATSRLPDLLSSGLCLDAGDELVGQHRCLPFWFRRLRCRRFLSTCIRL